MSKSLFLLLAVPIAVAADSSSYSTIEPGLYRITIGVIGEGAFSESIEECLTAEQLSADQMSILAADATFDGCTVTSNDWGDGKISMTLDCSVGNVNSKAVMTGTYDSISIDTSTILRMVFEDTEIDVESFMRYERIDDC